LKNGLINWEEMKAEIVPAEVIKSSTKYQVAIQYICIRDAVRLAAEYLSREMAYASPSQAYAKLALYMACP